MNRSNRVVRATICLLSLLAWVIAASGALASDDGEQDKAAAAIQGTWRVEAHDIRGEAASQKFLAQEFQWIFAKDGITMRNKKAVSRRGTFRLDSTSDPQTLDITLEPGLPPGPKAPAPQEEILRCIYALDGDTLRVCYGFSDDRPSALESKAQPATGLVLLRRLPPPKEEASLRLPR